MPSKKNSKKDEELFAKYPNLYEGISASDNDACMAFAEEYKAFLDRSKTEREFTENSIEAASSLGFVDIESKKKLTSRLRLHSALSI